MRHDPDSPGQAPDGRPMADQPRWRQDFPIDVPQDNYVARRDFTKFLVLTSFAFVVGQFWIGIQNALRRRRGKPEIRPIAQVEDVAVGSAVSFAYPHAHDACLLLRIDEQTFVAFSQKCTHLTCAVQPDFEHGQFHCPCHNGYFDLNTGRALAGPPRRPLPRITLKVRNGVVYATGVELSTT